MTSNCSSLDLHSEERKKSFEPSKRGQIGGGWRLALGHSDQSSNYLADDVFGEILLQFTLFKLLSHIAFEVVETLLCCSSQIFFFVAQHKEQILKKIWQIDQQIYRHDFIKTYYPLDEKLPHTGIFEL